MLEALSNLYCEPIVISINYYHYRYVSKIFSDSSLILFCWQTDCQSV